jgi:hypothetical protein
MLLTCQAWYVTLVWPLYRSLISPSVHKKTVRAALKETLKTLEAEQRGMMRKRLLGIPEREVTAHNI